jgi:DNA repair exonuclease SbcCD ATPase subunit
MRNYLRRRDVGGKRLATPAGPMATVPPLPNPELSHALVGDYESLHAAVHQGNALAADFREHSAGPANELAVLQQVFEKAQRDLVQLHRSIAELRQERHRLANEAMRAMALERKLAEVTTERDRLRAEGQAMRDGLIASSTDSAKRKRETDAQIARMAQELDTLRQRGLAPAPAVAADSEVRAALSQISATLERLTAQLAEDRGTPHPAPRPARGRAAAEPEIAIEFES